MKMIFTTIFLFCLITGCSSPTPWAGEVTSAGQYYIEIGHDGVTRGYQLHVPTGYNADSNVALHFDLHPWFGNAYVMEQMTSYRPYSDRDGFILVQPNGLSRSWNGGPKCCSPSNEENVDDVGFIRAIRDDLIARGLNIDIRKVYLDGMSNGGYLSNKIACEDSELVNGIAVVVGSMGYDSVLECQPSKPISVLMISGGDDSIEGRKQSFDRWLTLNSCSTSQSESIGTFNCETYTDCAGGVETTHCIGEGVGHCWPGTGFSLYGCNQDLDASQYILDFYNRISPDETAYPSTPVR
jgi:polyhydroxybutyrate depolymerase